MKKTTRRKETSEALALAFTLIGGIVAGVPVILYAFSHPALTATQVLLDRIPTVLVGFSIMAVAAVVQARKENKGKKNKDDPSHISKHF